jgi:type III pantothenate kinase
MLLAIDIGNTNIVLGLYQDKKLITHWRLATQAERTADEYGVILTQLVEHGGFRCEQISAIAVSCVVPPMLTTTQELAARFFDREPLIVGPGIKTGMPILYENPKDVGADRIVNGIAAFDKYRDACIVVDFGTATTIDLISPKGEYVGGAIAPGLSISLEALVQRASKLPRIEIVKPKEVVGRNTVNSIQAGIFFGYVGLVDGLVKRIQKDRSRQRRRHRRFGTFGGVGMRDNSRSGRVSHPRRLTDHPRKERTAIIITQ